MGIQDNSNLIIGSGAVIHTPNLVYEVFGIDSDDELGIIDTDNVAVELTFDGEVEDEDTEDEDTEDEDTEDEDDVYEVDDDDLPPFLGSSERYIGLKQLGHILGRCAYRLVEQNLVTVAEQLYLDALSIDPYNEMIGNMGIMYETRVKNIELAKKYYLMAIEGGDELAMYNLADLYDNEQNIELMVRYFEMAVQHGDDASRKRLILHYHKTADMPNFARHYYIQLSCEDCDYIDESCDNGDDYCLFRQSNNVLTIASQLERISMAGDEGMTDDIIRLCNLLHQTPQYCTFKNKVALFTRLNHVVECGICYDDDKVNIDIHCGHTVCAECYPMLYNKACPFCRQSPQAAVVA